MLMNRIFILAVLAPALVLVIVGCQRQDSEPDATATELRTTPAVTAVPAATAAATSTQTARPTAEGATASPVPSTPPPTTAPAAPSPSPTRRPIPRETPTPTPERTRSPTPTPIPVPAVYDSNQNMFLLLSEFIHPEESSLEALERAKEQRDISQVHVILESLPFFTRDLALAGIEAVAELTGQDFGFDLRRWREWLGPRLEEYAPPPDYARWKANMLSLIDPELGDLMEQAVDGGSRANLTEIVWGGVRTDGIPPLEFPPHVEPEEAQYLLPSDRVFGVSINGEHRAYPLRVMNAHELANDTLGGEPISLVY